MGERLRAPDRTRDRYLRTVGGHWASAPGYHGHLVLVDTGCGYWFSLDDDRGNVNPYTSWRVFQNRDQCGSLVVGPVCGIRPFCYCSVLDSLCYREMGSACGRLLLNRERCE